MNLLFTISAFSSLFVTLSSSGQSPATRSILGESHAREQVQAAVSSSSQAPFYKPLIATKNVVVATVEPMLFSIYGKQNIIKQRPYEVYLIDGYWYLSGTLPKAYRGGTFEIIVEANIGRILKLTHGK